MTGYLWCFSENKMRWHKVEKNSWYKCEFHAIKIVILFELKHILLPCSKDIVLTLSIKTNIQLHITGPGMYLDNMIAYHNKYVQKDYIVLMYFQRIMFCVVARNHTAFVGLHEYILILLLMCCICLEDSGYFKLPTPTIVKGISIIKQAYHYRESKIHHVVLDIASK